MKNTRLKAARVEKDLSQQQLADMVGVSRRTISMVESGKYNPTLNLCINICKKLGRTLNDLFWQTLMQTCFFV
ncbi:MAG TPA: helix-turn-helix transcriptional regulator [Syntrophomonadaceae bacterium]|nr:helix-turn-helix transcriptional regulator [Syntrophomonadaceae bacterium]